MPLRKGIFMKKLSFLLVVLLLLFSCLMMACSKEDGSNQPQVATQQSTVPEETTAPKDEDIPIVHASISVQQLKDYEIVSAKSASGEVVQMAESLRVTMQTVFDMPINKKTANAYNKTQYEILVGDTNREESATFLENMKWGDYGYGIVGEKLVIAGKNEDGTLAALRAFIQYVSDHEGGDVFFSNADSFLFQQNYPYQSITINGISASEFSIVCNQEELGGMAYVIRDAIIESCGIAVPIITDVDVTAGNKLIIIGESAYVPQKLIEAFDDADIAKDSGYIGVDENILWLNANNAGGFWTVVEEVTVETSGKGSDNITLKSSEICSGYDKITVMSFNLKAEDKSAEYNKRVDAVVETILKYRPSVIGVQEATDTWIALLNQRLGDIYTIVGDGRNADGGGEHSAILYLTEEFDCLESGTKWLSDTPDVAGSKFAESHYTRIMTYVHLSRKSDGKEFLHVNTHLDYGTTEVEEAVKVAQMQVLLEQIAKFSGTSTIITGDFNATVDSPVYQMINKAGYEDALLVFSAVDRSPTYHALMGTTGTPSHIDFVFENGFSYAFHRICTERVNNENVSDHYPIFAILYTFNDGK